MEYTSTLQECGDNCRLENIYVSFFRDHVDENERYGGNFS